MFKNQFIIQSFGVFFRHHPIRLITLFLITLFLGFNQGISIVLLIPLLGLLVPGQTSATTNKLTDFLNSILNRAGLEVNLTLILLVFAICLISVAVLTYFQSIIQTSYQQSFSYQTRKRLFKKIITSDWSFLNGNSKHNHIQILTTEIPKMTNYYYFYLGLTTRIIFITAHVVLAMMISVKFTLFVVFVGLVLFIFLRKYLKKAQVLGDANIQAFRKMLKHIDDFWLTVKMAKVHNTEAFYFDKFDQSNTLMLDYQYNQVKNRAIPQLLFTLAGILSLVMVVYFAHSVARLPLTSLFVLILLFARIFPQFMGMNNDLNMLVSNIASVKMVLALDREIKEQAFEVVNTGGEIELIHQIEIKKLNFAYETDHPLFVDFSESIPALKITGIIGKSGCGKTTLIDILAGLQKSEDKVVDVDGVTLQADQLPTWRSELGYLPQDSFFIDGTIRENLIWDSRYPSTDDQIFDVLRQVNAATLVSGQKQGLDTSIANYQYHFSGGEKQRLALARVLLRRPKLLLLDEATSALDVENEAQIMECLVRLKQKLTIVFVTHRQSLKPYFDKIIDLDTYFRQNY